MLFRIYRIAHATSDAYPLGIFWLYCGLFLLTFATVFTFPPVGLMLVFAGLAGLIFAVLGAKVLAWIERSLARTLLARGICPACAMRQLPQPEIGEWRCGGCESCFLRSGRPQQPSPASPATS